jgi:ADP-ribose pyrophosphatase YjhB (NUDIX family)
MFKADDLISQLILLILCIGTGLIEENETADVAAMRELKEATGFIGTIKKIGPVLAMDPGASSCSMRLVTVEVSFCIMQPRNVKL